MPVPRATYRFQFNENFRLTHALALVPYLSDLGISHVYASPLFKACPHSAHGYDGCDYNQLNPEIGTEAELETLVHALHENKMGLIVDIVPNHMGIGTPENAWWWDVLKNGRKSAYASYFDIQWDGPDAQLQGKVLIPILGDHYETVLKKGELKLREENDEIVLTYFTNQFPLAPATVPEIHTLTQLNADPVALDKLIREQNYRLAYYVDGDKQLNYRRFFAVSTLAALRIEDEKVFNDVHALLKTWLDKKWIDGLRIDHIDGLREPEMYLRRLRALAPHAWILVEKILMAKENLPPAWPIQGTTGYDFLIRLNGLFINPESEGAFTTFYNKFTGETTDYPALMRAKKLLALNELLVTEVNRLTALLGRIVVRHQGEFSAEELAAVIKETIASYPVYRAYISPDKKSVAPADTDGLDQAIHDAKKCRSDLPVQLFNFLHELLRLQLPGELENEFIVRFQQLTGPAMAKGVEDTAFYCFNRFASLNEVGGNPGIFGESVESFHKFCEQQQFHWPHAMLTTSTHDTKRAEDVRARLNVLSEIPERWIEAVQHWSALSSCYRRNNFPDHGAEYLLYQTLVGAWPLPAERLLFFAEKASCEAGELTKWSQRNKEYDAALRAFCLGLLGDAAFKADFEKFLAPVVDAGYANSVAQTLIKLTAPGIPDIYQGCELWDLSLVDPDNRRPVDFELRERLLAEVGKVSAEAAWSRRAEGLPKLWVMQKTLNLRAKSDIFEGDYQPLFARGEKADHLIAFLRGGRALTLASRFTLDLDTWGNTILELPAGKWQNEFTGETFYGAVNLGKCFEKFPVALLIKKELS